MANPRLLVVGAGAVGGYFGGRLADAGRDVTFLVRPARAAVLREQGLRISSPLGDACVVPEVILASEIAAPYDIVFLSLKAYTLEAALTDFAPAVGPDTVILPMLNGLQHIDRLLERFGKERVVGGICRIAVQLRDGGVEHMSSLQQIAYGELDGIRTERIAEVDEVMQGMGFDARISDDIVQDLWEKWIQLAALGAATCLFDGPIGRIARVPAGTPTVRTLWRECVSIASLCGRAPRGEFASDVETQLTNPDSTLTSSMYRDMKAGSPVEVEAILGDLVARGKAAGVDSPILQAATVALRVYAAGRSIEG